MPLARKNSYSKVPRLGFFWLDLNILILFLRLKGYGKVSNVSGFEDIFYHGNLQQRHATWVWVGWASLKPNWSSPGYTAATGEIWNKLNFKLQITYLHQSSLQNLPIPLHKFTIYSTLRGVVLRYGCHRSQQHIIHDD